MEPSAARGSSQRPLWHGAPFIKPEDVCKLTATSLGCLGSRREDCGRASGLRGTSLGHTWETPRVFENFILVKTLGLVRKEEPGLSDPQTQAEETHSRK